MDSFAEALQDTLGFTLVGPYDVLAGRHKDVACNSTGRRPNFLLHWRYYYDPPEFLTVIKGDSDKQFHLGYFRWIMKTSHLVFHTGLVFVTWGLMDC